MTIASARPNLTPRPARRWLRSLASDTAGAALIEITLFMPILVLMAVAIMNFGFYFSYQIRVENSAQAGAQWAITNAWQNNAYTPSSITIAGTCCDRRPCLRFSPPSASPPPAASAAPAAFSNFAAVRAVQA